MPRCWRRGSTAPAASSASRRARRMRSIRRCSGRRRKGAISWRCSDRLASAGASRDDSGAGASMAVEKRLNAEQLQRIFLEFAEAMRELPPDIEAGWLDAQGELRLAPDVGRKLRTARNVREVLRQIREAERDEG